MSTCASCGADLAGDWKFCIKCGAPVGLVELIEPTAADPIEVEAEDEPTEVEPEAVVEPEEEPTEVEPEAVVEPEEEPTEVEPEAVVEPEAEEAPEPIPAAIRPDAVEPPRFNILAILALLLACIGGAPALIFGHVALGQIKESGERGRTIALIATVLGYFWLVVWVVIITLVVTGVWRG